jgi:hypothetical protein
VAADADEHHTLSTVALAHELADVHHARGGHIGGPGVAHVRVVLPHHGAAALTVVAHEAVSVSAMWQSRTFQDSPSARTIVR